MEKIIHNPNDVRFRINPDINLAELKDSMQVDSGQLIAELTVGKFKTRIHVRGDVYVWYNPHPNGDPRGKDGTYYRSPSRFPEKLLALFRDGQADCAPNVDIERNNWFEYSVIDTEKNQIVCSMSDNDWDNPQTPVELLSGMWDFFQENIKN